jgi:hypothetical protein
MGGIVAMIVGLLGFLGMAFGLRRVGRKVEAAKTKADVRTIRKVAELARGAVDETRIREFAEADLAERQYRSQIRIDRANQRFDPVGADQIIQSIDEFPAAPPPEEK